MTHIYDHFLTAEDTKELTPTELHEHIVKLYNDATDALNDENTPKEDRKLYWDVRDKLQFITKLASYKKEGDVLTHQEARQIYALGVVRMTFGYDYARAIANIPTFFGKPAEEIDTKSLPFNAEKPDFYEALNAAQTMVNKVRAFHSGEKTLEQLGWEEIYPDDDTHQDKPSPV